MIPISPLACGTTAKFRVPNISCSRTILANIFFFWFLGEGSGVATVDHLLVVNWQSAKNPEQSGGQRTCCHADLFKVNNIASSWSRLVRTHMGFNGTTAHGNRDLEEDSDFLEEH
ncbi:hypothetical protein KQX54_004586 [Cotesia glomerata]|uniref:Uncharacterized protein n=1 Tax=Cotesia glomerata TaxID=32391 RepID=A0AAV7ICK9_COTGL|nr:hypothetical protein KQX54_004586 [Cotesia glomerata]